MVIQSLCDNQIVLDAGSGNMALDDPCIIRMDVQLTPYVDLVGDLHALPFKPECLDFVFSLAVVEHLRQPFTAADEIFAVLKPGGYVYAECNFVFAYHGFPHHYFNASIHGLEQVFERFAKLRLGVAPYQMPSFTIENVMNTYLALFEPETKSEAKFVKAMQEVLRYPLRDFDARFSENACFRLAAGDYFFGLKQPDEQDRIIPDEIWDVYLRTPELQSIFARPLDLTLPDNLMIWAHNEGRREFKEIEMWFAGLEPFSKHTDPSRSFDRSVIRALPPIPDFSHGPFAGTL
jgi:SAM-dependent methyltransferase